jgi:hypothetical protein
VFATVLFAVARAEDPEASAPRDEPWRGGWTGLADIEKLIECAKETHFNALIAHGPKERMKAFSELARDNQIESFHWFSLTANVEEMASLRQVMGEGNQKRLDEIKADKDPRKGGYQFGGEPLPGRHEVLLSPLLCFHLPEVAEYSRKCIREMLDACPALTGVAFDYFGYQNYHCCRCPRSEELFRAFREAHAGLGEDEALKRFSLDSLVKFTNDLADFVREVRPQAKVAIHVYPVFQPEPLYGNRLDVDYCCQTVAWFFEPYWSLEKVERYTRTVVREQNRYHRRQHGIPFVGVYIGRESADKPPERLAQELRTIHRVAGNTSLSVCTFNDLVKSAELRKTVREAERGFLTDNPGAREH